MAANVQSTVIYDGGNKTVLKVVGSFGAANTTNTTLLVSNTLYGANAAGGKICLLNILKLYYHVSLAGRVSLEWISSVNTNATILTFGGQSGGAFLEQAFNNNANTPTGDLNLNVQNAQANDVFDFVITFNKDTGVYGAPYAGAWANVNAGY